MNKKGAANYGADFGFGVALFFILMIILFMFSSCVKGNKEDNVEPPLTKLRSQEELITMLQFPVDYDGQQITFSRLLTKYYHAKVQNSNEAGKLKQEIEKFLAYYIALSGQDSCRVLVVATPGDELKIQNGNCNLKDLLDHKDCYDAKNWGNAILPLEPYSNQIGFAVLYLNSGIRAGTSNSYHPDWCD